MSRRRFLQAAAVGGLALVGGPVRAARRPHPRVVIVGAGLAGLNAAWTLKRAGLHAAVYEGAHRVGGRVLTVHGALAPGLATELGGSFLNSDHHEMFRLVKELGLQVDDLKPPGQHYDVAYNIRGTSYSEAQIVEALRPFVIRMRDQMPGVGDDVDVHTQGTARALDWIPLSDFLDRVGLRTGWLRDLLDAAYVTEFGAELDDQSSLNLLLMTARRPRDPRIQDFDDLAMTGADERWMVRGGNQRVADELARRLEGQIHPDHRLEALRAHGSGYRLTFAAGGRSRDVDADFVILAVPFSTLRHVTLEVELPPEKRRAIDALGYGTNAKVAVGFTRRTWREQKKSGLLIRESPYQLAWDDSFTQPVAAGALTFFLGGLTGVGVGSGSVHVQAARLLEGLDGIFPGVTATANGKAVRFHWPTYPFTRGAYAFYRPGQWTTIRGTEIRPVGRILFAGEHCSQEYTGYMNGAAETGRRAARGVLAAV